ncbi:DUF4123 domain-containing protein [uncultured Marinobacter sp.]|uniref:DUF4123 domain-containing protein n=1 Tax=uncultured Marinobacter sp. TaxID=187379 RepID=UPI00260D2CB2|nr:DUF4123 domain-containing protein [uncultured Marinobacter sp.]
MWPFDPQMRTFAIIDAAIPQLRERCYALSAASNSEPLYVSTPFAHLIEISPILLEITSDSPLLAWLSENRPTLNWGVLLASDSDLSAVATHLRKTLTVKSIDDDEMMLRFYDPDTLPVFWDALSTTEQRLFSGPVTQWAARKIEGNVSWWQAARPLEEADATMKDLGQPWLKLTSGHRNRLRVLFHRSLRAQVITRLNTTITWRLMHLEPAFVESRVDESLNAMYQWLSDPEESQSTRFCRLCIEHSSHFYQSRQAQSYLNNMGFDQAMDRLEQEIAVAPNTYAEYHDREWMPDFDENVLTEKRRQQRWSNQG